MEHSYTLNHFFDWIRGGRPLIMTGLGRGGSGFRDQPLQPGLASVRSVSELMTSHISTGFMKALNMARVTATAMSQSSGPDQI